MSIEQIQILLILVATMLLFLWGRFRHDLVAMATLLTCVLAGLVPPAAAFYGLGHPAVVTVACVLVLSRGLTDTGAVDVLARRLLPSTTGPTSSIAALVALGALLSAFVNNVGAMALLLPLALRTADKHGLPAGKVLMPLAFGTILGGMTTLIGTPPNLIVAAFRADTAAAGFGMFDFTPVGLAVAVVGIAFVTLAGSRLVPSREHRIAEGFDTGTYFAEARVTAGGKAEGKTLSSVQKTLDEADAQVIGLVRDGLHIPAPGARRQLRAGDILVVEAEPESLADALSSLDLDVAAPSPVADSVAGGDDAPDATDTAGSSASLGDVELQELVVRPGSELVDRTPRGVGISRRFGVNLLAVSRQGRRTIKRLGTTRIRAGDVLLIQGNVDALADFAMSVGCLPLAERAIRIPRNGQAILATAVMAAAVAGTAVGLMPAAIAFAAGALVYVATRIVPPANVYASIDWSVIILLGALIPVAGAMAATGTADLIARFLLESVAFGNPIVALTIILVVTMTLSDFMNNAATAAVMCPVAISTAEGLHANPDAFLMAVAVGASCAFLTPIGHQNNTLILGPGGFRFSDYWRLGFPLELVVVAVGVPMLLLVWPL